MLRLVLLALLVAPTAGADALVAFTTPDAGAAPVVDLLDAAHREILVEAYTLTSQDVAAALERALHRGVQVRLVLEGAPVGGVPWDQARLLAALVEAGADVRLMRGAEAPFRNVHAKAIVVDQEALLVATENFHDTSYPPWSRAHGTRGYGIVLWNATLARALAEVIEADLEASQPLLPTDLPPPLPLRATAGARPGATLRLESAPDAALALSPGGASAVIDMIANARERVDVAMLFAQPRFDDAPNPLLEALVEAARRGAHVRLLLDGHVQREANAAVAASLNERARREGLPLEARVDDAPRTLHAKLVMVDGARFYVGSMNWGRASAEKNREVGLVLEEPRVARAWLGVFERDWAKESERKEVPTSAGAGGILLAVALLKASRRRSPCPSRRR